MLEMAAQKPTCFLSIASLMFVAFTSVVSFTMKCFVVLAFYMMSEEDISYVCERGLGFYAAEPDNDDRSSDWSVVSGPGTPRSPSQNNLTGPEQCDFGINCQHRHLTLRGTNHFKVQVKCKACKTLISERLTPAGIRARAAKRQRGNGGVEEE